MARGGPNHGLSRCWGALLYDSSIPGSWAYLFSVGIVPKVHGERRTQRGALWGGVGGPKARRGGA